MNFFNVNLFGFQTINFISIKRFAQVHCQMQTLNVFKWKCSVNSAKQ